MFIPEDGDGAGVRLQGGGAPVVERAVLAAPGQLVELLPGWVPLTRQLPHSGQAAVAVAQRTGGG